jgi:uncharacterized protein (TIGR02145 family)
MKSKLFLLLFLTLTLNGCDKDDEIVEIETEQIVNGRIVFSGSNEIPNNLKVLSLDGVIQLDSNSTIDLPTSANGLEFLLNANDEIVFIRRNYPNSIDNNLSSESTILFLSTFNTLFYNLTDINQSTIISQILEHPNFDIAKNFLDNAVEINIYSNEFKENIQSIVNEIFSEENISPLSTDAPLVDVNYSNNSNVISFSNNTSNHIGYSVKLNGVQNDFGLIDGNQTLSYELGNQNTNYDFKMMSGADLNGVFSDNQLEEIEAFNADFNDFLFEAIEILLEIAISELNDDCLETIFNALVVGINFAEDYGNNNNANDAFIEAFSNLAASLPSLVEGGLDCIEVGDSILGDVLSTLNLINDAFNISNFLNETGISITEYYAYENLSEKCFFYNGDDFLECDNITVSPPYNPNPSNNAIDVPLTGELSFTAGLNTPSDSSFKIYFGDTDNLTEFEITNSTNNTYSGVEENSTYYWKVETLSNSGSVLTTSPLWSFTTIADNNLATVTSNSITGITQNSATSGGNVTDDGGNAVTIKGICYSTTPNPTTADNTSNDGTGTGAFTSNITGLTANTTYYVKAYATNSEGTAYGNEISFTTLNSSSTTEPAYNPIPNDNSTNTSLNGNLSFTEGNNTPTDAIFKVYFDTSSNPNTVFNLDANVNTLNYSNLQEATPYYWKVETISNTGNVLATSPIWSFTTATNSGGTAVVDVLNPITGKTWMDRNLGASQAATSSTDAAAYGDLYQWGRAADGHEKRNSGITSTLSTTDNPGHGDFITIGSSPYDWRSPQNDDLWQGVNGTNNPCPSGYRLPTITELDAERTSWSSDNSAGAFASPLKLLMAGYRISNNGSLNDVGSFGYFWSSTVGGGSARFLIFGNSSIDTDLSWSIRAYGHSVRCLKD